jgi:hypothetical protein
MCLLKLLFQKADGLNLRLLLQQKLAKRPEEINAHD